MTDSVRTISAFSESQTVGLRYFESVGSIEEWLSGLVKIHENDGDPYYLHIDQLQILPREKNGSYPVFTIYHRIYLKRGE